MAGFVFNLDSMESLNSCIENGLYSTNLSPPVNNIWKIHHEGTFADFFAMKPGDNVYFFIKRKIYGIGQLVNLGEECYSLNYPDSDVPNTFNGVNKREEMLIDINGTGINNRCICYFNPGPAFFRDGVDMDDVLSSNPFSFRILRAFWKLSFLKLPDAENQALKDVLLVRNEQNLNSKVSHFPYYEEKHREIQTKLCTKYSFNHQKLLMYASKKDMIKHEMAIEASLLSMMSKTSTLFGNWDYLSHQVIASPFKAIDYMDKMDIFGYRFIQGFKTISKYLCIEIKKDAAKRDSIDQIMKYVDWINNEYTYGNYEMIEAFVVAYEIPPEVVEYKNEIAVRNYMQGLRPTISKTWTNVRLIEYKYNSSITDLVFTEIH